MKTMKLKFPIILLLLGFTTAQAQVGINTTNPDTTAILHIYSDNKGVLLPTVSDAVRGSLKAAPAAEGLLVYDSIDKVYYFFNRTSKEWLALNPFQTTENDDPNGNNDDVQLSAPFKDRNVVIGTGNADLNAKLHVKGNIKANDTLYARQANVSSAYISDSTWSQKIGSTSLATTTINADIIQATTTTVNTINASTINSKSIVPVGAIIMWTGNTIPDCWQMVGEMAGKFPVGAGSSKYTAGTSIDSEGKSGLDAVALEVSQMPSHSHSITRRSPNSGSGDRDYVSGTNGGNPVTNSNPIENEGGGQPHENRPPFYAVYFIKKTSNNCP